ncbi:hypothetical protein SLS62_003191 [Diatrype stigma]|uniref:Microsomal glutathione S-transferase 3 n=1 Tax=Diatrype stigma TaxID=117547 RepID=A0AAN9YUA4_9PEZI
MPGLLLEVPAEYGYTLAVVASTFLLNTCHMLKTSGARRVAKIPYPHSYATAEQADKDPKAFAFNCAQRAHANYIENVTTFTVSLLVTSLAFPRAGAALGAVWVAGRFMYLVGYTSSAGPKGRLLGFVTSAVCQVALGFMGLVSAVKFLPAW